MGLMSFLDKKPGLSVVGVAANCLEIQEKLPKTKPHILLLDLRMPGSDFLENISWVAEHLPWVKIIAFSAYYSPDLVRSLFKNKVQGYIHKSAPTQEILKAIKTVYNGEKYYSSLSHHYNGFHNSGESLASDDFQKRLQLSKRELEVLVLICQGQTSTRIGKSLFISKHTVETHRKNIFRKLDVNSSTELVRFAYEHGLI